jgi:hypothetical protein
VRRRRRRRGGCHRLWGKRPDPCGFWGLGNVSARPRW